ncbi:hypothetical protein RG47T_2587 [Mucilaginibacter polytrichastri]|uniref:Uncharacterized protein n=1 Tax=Mucilaginibacter polytrichastri TaxID=1302689 RepID=A0A1Q5ZZF4_9SPHI|nr:hypothetical protein RG47T_2587 [Mucilaginibacter polytrichastri]
MVLQNKRALNIFMLIAGAKYSIYEKPENVFKHSRVKL